LKLDIWFLIKDGVGMKCPQAACPGQNVSGKSLKAQRQQNFTLTERWKIMLT